jgi:hypothetical protein
MPALSAAALSGAKSTHKRAGGPVKSVVSLQLFFAATR